MVNLFDIMRGAQHGSVYDNFARQFGLSVVEAQRAVEALLPAFSLGLQRSSANPSTFANLLGMMSSGRFAPFYDDALTGIWPQAQASGNDVLGQLFGSPDMIRRIAGQASSVSGIGAPLLQQMMPVLAATLMGGLFRFASVEGFADFLRQWADWLTVAKLSSPPPRRSAPEPANPFAPWIEMMGTLFGPKAQASGPKTQAAAPVPAPTESPKPPADLWTEMVRAWTGAQAPPPPPPPPPPAARPNPFESLAQMFDTGREVQAQHLASLQAMFDAVWGTARPR